MAWTKDDGASLAEARKRAGWSQEKLAKKAEISAAYITKLERAIHDPSERMRKDLSRALGLSEPNFLVTSDSDTFEERDGGDPYPKRSEVTHLPMFRNASAAVQNALLGQRFSDGDRSITYWVTELERLILKEAAGELHSLPKDAEVWVESKPPSRR